MSRQGKEIKRAMREVESLTERIKNIQLPALDEAEQKEVAAATAETTGGNGKGGQPVNPIQPSGDPGLDSWKAQLQEKGFIRLKEDQYRMVVDTIWKGFGLTYPGYRNVNDMINDLFQGQVEMFLIRGTDLNELSFMILDRISEYRRTARVRFFNPQGKPDYLQEGLPMSVQAVQDSLPWLETMDFFNTETMEVSTGA